VLAFLRSEQLAYGSGKFLGFWLGVNRIKHLLEYPIPVALLGSGVGSFVGLFSWLIAELNPTIAPFISLGCIGGGIYTLCRKIQFELEIHSRKRQALDQWNREGKSDLDGEN